VTRSAPRLTRGPFFLRPDENHHRRRALTGVVLFGRRTRVRAPRRFAVGLPPPPRAHPEGDRGGEREKAGDDRGGGDARRARRRPRRLRHPGLGRGARRVDESRRIRGRVARRRAPQPRPRDRRAHHRARAGDDHRAGRAETMITVKKR